MDLNYGVGRRLQLKFEMPWVRVEGAETETESGAGNATVGVKWRFVGQEGQTIAWSIYPQFEFNTTHASVTRRIEDAGYKFLMPTELTIEMRGVEMNGEIGRTFVQHGSGGWIVGLSTESHIAPPLELVAEIRRNELTELMAIGGGRLELTSKVILLLARGHTVRSAPPEGPRTYVYAGLQFNVRDSSCLLRRRRRANVSTNDRPRWPELRTDLQSVAASSRITRHLFGRSTFAAPNHHADVPSPRSGQKSDPFKKFEDWRDVGASRSIPC